MKYFMIDIYIATADFSEEYLKRYQEKQNPENTESDTRFPESPSPPTPPQDDTLANETKHKSSPVLNRRYDNQRLTAEQYRLSVRDRTKSFSGTVTLDRDKYMSMHHDKSVFITDSQGLEKLKDEDNYYAHSLQRRPKNKYNVMTGCDSPDLPDDIPLPDNLDNLTDQEAAELMGSSKEQTNVLTFRKGDVFGVLEGPIEKPSATWWSVLALRYDTVGYVPASYLQFDSRRHSWLSRYGVKSSRDVHMKALTELQNNNGIHPEVVYGSMIPDPDYSDEETDRRATSSNMVVRNNRANSKEDKRVDENGLIMPKKLINPCMESTDRKDLHRELLFNQKRGNQVIGTKSELQKALEKRKDKKILKELEKERLAQLTPLQKAIDERAQKIEQQEKVEKEAPTNNSASEFHKIHAKVRSKVETE